MLAILEQLPAGVYYAVMLRVLRDGANAMLPMLKIADKYEPHLRSARVHGNMTPGILDAMLDGSYQRVLSELDLLGGVVEQTMDVYHDLATSFDRVNAKYFNESLRRPRLVWSHTFTSCRFGHYDQTSDTVMVSMSLDKKDVREYVVDFIMYHELLHKTLGVTWKNLRQAVHTRQFLKKERRLHRYREAKDILKKLASGQH